MDMPMSLDSSSSNNEYCTINPGGLVMDVQEPQRTCMGVASWPHEPFVPRMLTSADRCEEPVASTWNEPGELESASVTFRPCSRNAIACCSPVSPNTCAVIVRLDKCKDAQSAADVDAHCTVMLLGTVLRT